MSSCERPSNSSVSAFGPSAVSSVYCFSTSSQGASRRCRANSSPSLVCSFSRSSSPACAASHASREVVVTGEVVVSMVWSLRYAAIGSPGTRAAFCPVTSTVLPAIASGIATSPCWVSASAPRLTTATPQTHRSRPAALPRLSRSGRLRDAVADAGGGVDDVGRAQLASEPGDGDLDRVGERVNVLVPRLLEQPLGAEGGGRGREQGLEHGTLLRGELDRSSVPGDGAGQLIELDPGRA